MVTIGCADAARRAGARLAKTATEDCDCSADNVSQGFDVAQRDAQVVAIGAAEAGHEDDSGDHARQDEFHDIEQDHAEHATPRGVRRPWR